MHVQFLFQCGIGMLCYIPAMFYEIWPSPMCIIGEARPNKSHSSMGTVIQVFGKLNIDTDFRLGHPKVQFGIVINFCGARAMNPYTAIIWTPDGARQNAGLLAYGNGARSALPGMEPKRSVIWWLVWQQIFLVLWYYLDWVCRLVSACTALRCTTPYMARAYSCEM